MLLQSSVWHSWLDKAISDSYVLVVVVVVVVVGSNAVIDRLIDPDGWKSIKAYTIEWLLKMSPGAGSAFEGPPVGRGASADPNRPSAWEPLRRRRSLWFEVVLGYREGDKTPSVTGRDFDAHRDAELSQFPSLTTFNTNHRWFWRVNSTNRWSSLSVGVTAATVPWKSLSETPRSPPEIRIPHFSIEVEVQFEMFAWSSRDRHGGSWRDDAYHKLLEEWPWCGASLADLLVFIDDFVMMGNASLQRWTQTRRAVPPPLLGARPLAIGAGLLGEATLKVRRSVTCPGPQFSVLAKSSRCGGPRRLARV